MDENFLNFASQVMNDWTDDIKRIADALERISPPHGFDYMSTMNLDGLDDAVAQGWQAYSVTEGGANYSGVWYHMRRPRRAPKAVEDKEPEPLRLLVEFDDDEEAWTDKPLGYY